MSDTAERTIVKSVPNAVLYSDGTILVKNVVASYPYVFEAKANTDPKTGKVTGHSYQITGLMPKDTHDEAKKLIVKAINNLLEQKNEGNKIPSDRKFLKDGDPKDEDDAGKPENAGMWVVSTREQKKPVLLSNKKDPKTGKARRLTALDADTIYGGCFVNILIRPWWQNSPDYGKRVNCGVSVVQFVKDGEAFGKGRITDDVIDEAFGAEDGDDAEVDGDDGGDEL